MTAQIVNLIEWETREPSKGSPLAGPVLAGHPAAQRLAETLTRDGRIEILELARGLVVYADANDVCRQKIACKLNALPGKAEDSGEGTRQRRLADPRHVFKQHVPARQDGHEHQFHHFLFADKGLPHSPDNRLALGLGGLGGQWL